VCELGVLWLLELVSLVLTLRSQNIILSVEMLAIRKYIFSNCHDVSLEASFTIVIIVWQSSNGALVLRYLSL
jgi:hypothetical protein